MVYIWFERVNLMKKELKYKERRGVRPKIKRKGAPDQRNSFLI